MHLMLPIYRPVPNSFLCIFTCIFFKLQTDGEGVEYISEGDSGKIVM